MFRLFPDTLTGIFNENTLSYPISLEVLRARTRVNDLLRA
jgi:hypothetical protein